MKNHKLKSLLLIMIILFSAVSLHAQNTFPSSGAAGIGTATPNASSLLEISSTTKGMLIPRMSKAQRDAIASPATGLLIYQTNNTPGFYYYSGSAWTAVSGKNANKTLSNLNTPTAVNVDLLPGTTGTLNLGSSGLDWNNLFLHGSIRFPDNVTQPMMYMFSNNTANPDKMVIAHSPAFPGWGLQYQDGPDKFNFLGNGTPVLTADLNNKRVGIGTSSPAYPLTVATTASVNSAISATSTYPNADNTIISAEYTGAISTADVIAVGGSSYSGMENGIGGSFSGGSIGVKGFGSNDQSGGTATGVLGMSNTVDFTGSYGVYGSANAGGASSAIGVYGNAIMTENGIGVYGVGGNYAGYFSGQVYSTIGYTTSDQRLKKNISGISNELDKLLALAPSIYEFRRDEFSAMHLPQGRQYGMIAQDVEKDFPELVQTIHQPRLTDPLTHHTIQDAMDFKAINYNGFIPIIISAMKDEHKTLNDKGVQIETLQKEVSELKSMLAALSSSDSGDGFAKVAFDPSTSMTLLGQNIPNPFDNSTLIPFRIPKNCHDASIMITNSATSEVISVIPISCNEDHVSIDAGVLAGGTYSYSLYVDGSLIQTKLMAIVR